MAAGQEGIKVAARVVGRGIDDSGGRSALFRSSFVRVHNAVRLRKLELGPDSTSTMDHGIGLRTSLVETHTQCNTALYVSGVKAH